MCLYPKLIENRKYRANIKNGGIIPPIKDQRVRLVPIGCEECIECRKQKARSWQIRLLEDIKTNTNGKFITLTFSNQSIKELTEKTYELNEKRIQAHYSGKQTNKRAKMLKGYTLDNEIATTAVRLFMERWRKKYKTSLRHWLVTEIGHKGTENIHLHGIIWTDENLLTVENIWKYGFIWKGHKKNGKLINYVNAQTTNYISKYINKIDMQHKTFKSKILASSGIGGNYINTRNSRKNIYQGTKTDELYMTNTGHKMTIPIYYRNKIYTEEQREQLWLQKLDKEERWICGEKVNIKNNNNKAYYQLLEYHRTRNRELGYGNDEKNWKRKIYEQQRRTIMQNARIKDGEQILNRIQGSRQKELR